MNDAKKIINDDIVLAHRIYAREIIKMYHGEEYIKDSEERYNKIANKKISDDIEIYELKEKSIYLIDI